MKVRDLISKLQAMPAYLDVTVYNSQEELVIATDIALEFLWFGNGSLDGCVDHYHHPDLDQTKKEAIIIK